MDDRIQIDVKGLVSVGLTPSVKVHAVPERETMSYMGGSAFGVLSGFDETVYVTAAEYTANPAIIHVKCKLHKRLDSGASMHLSQFQNKPGN